MHDFHTSLLYKLFILCSNPWMCFLVISLPQFCKNFTFIYMYIIQDVPNKLYSLDAYVIILLIINYMLTVTIQKNTIWNVHVLYNIITRWDFTITKTFDFRAGIKLEFCNLIQLTLPLKIPQEIVKQFESTIKIGTPRLE